MDGTDGARRPAVHRGLRTAGPRIAALGLLLALPACGGLATGRAPWAAMERIAVEGERFVGARSREPFLPVGFDYGHDGEHRLLESYWASEWDRVERDLEAMRTLGATVVRIHLQLGRFMRGPDEPDPEALGRLARLLRRAEALGLRLDLTGLGNQFEQYDEVNAGVRSFL